MWKLYRIRIHTLAAILHIILSDKHIDRQQNPDAQNTQRESVSHFSLLCHLCGRKQQECTWLTGSTSEGVCRPPSATVAIISSKQKKKKLCLVSEHSPLQSIYLGRGFSLDGGRSDIVPSCSSRFQYFLFPSYRATWQEGSPDET